MAVLFLLVAVRHRDLHSAAALAVLVVLKAASPVPMFVTLVLAKLIWATLALLACPTTTAAMLATELDRRAVVLRDWLHHQAGPPTVISPPKPHLWTRLGVIRAAWHVLAYQAAWLTVVHRAAPWSDVDMVRLEWPPMFFLAATGFPLTWLLYAGVSRWLFYVSLDGALLLTAIAHALTSGCDSRAVRAQTPGNQCNQWMAWSLAVVWACCMVLIPLWLQWMLLLAGPAAMAAVLHRWLYRCSMARSHDADNEAKRADTEAHDADTDADEAPSSVGQGSCVVLAVVVLLWWFVGDLRDLVRAYWLV